MFSSDLLCGEHHLVELVHGIHCTTALTHLNLSIDKSAMPHVPLFGHATVYVRMLIHVRHGSSTEQLQTFDPALEAVGGSQWSEISYWA